MPTATQTHLAQRLATHRHLATSCPPGAPEHREAVADLLTALAPQVRPELIDLVAQVRAWLDGGGLPEGFDVAAVDLVDGWYVAGTWRHPDQEPVVGLCCAAASTVVAATAVVSLWGLDRIIFSETPWADAIRALAR